MAKNKKTKETNKACYYGNIINGVIYYMDSFDIDFLKGLSLMKEVAEGDK